MAPDDIYHPRKERYANDSGTYMIISPFGSENPDKSYKTE